MRFRKATLCAITLLLGGCLLTSLHPLYNDETIIFREELISKWVDEDDVCWQFRQTDGKEYLLRLWDDEIEIGRFEAHLIEIDGFIFLDLSPDLSPLVEMDDFYKIHFQPVHTFLKVDQIEPEVRLSGIKYDIITEILENDPYSLKHELIDDRIVLTANTEELQNFIMEYIDILFEESDESSKLIRLKALYSDEDIVFDVNLIGLWEGTSNSILIVHNQGNKICDIVIMEEDGTEQQFYANLVKYDDGMLLAVFADEAELDPNEPDAYKFHLTPDWFWKVEYTETELRLQQIEHKKAAYLLQNDKSPLKQKQTDIPYLFRYEN